MPNLDGTGPIGRGAMTGRGLGNCRQTFRSKLNRIQRETGEPQINRQRLADQPVNDVFIRRGQNRKG